MPRAKEELSFKKGERVEAKSSGNIRYYVGTVVEVNRKQYKIQFNDGSVSTVKLADIRPAKSETTKRPTRQLRSRSRSKSAGRKPASKSRSPTRKPSSKVEKRLPIRSEKETTPEDKKEKEDSPEATARKKVDEVDKADKVEVTKSSSSSQTEYVVKNSSTEKVVYSEVQKTETSIKNAVQPRTSARIAALQVTRAVTGNATLEQTESRKRIPDLSSKAKFSDDESEDDDEEVKVICENPKGFSLLSFLAIVLKIMLIPSSVLFFCFACNKKYCTALEIPPSYSKWKDFENDVKIPLLILSAFHLILTIFSKLPLGKQVKGLPFGTNSMTMSYRLNGFFLLLMSTITFSVLAYYGFNMNWGYDKIRQITVSSIIYATFWSIVLHGYALIKRKEIDSTSVHYSSGSFLDGFYHGFEINPMLFGKVDIKSRFIHFGLIGLVLLNYGILCKHFFAHNYVAIPLVLTTAMQIFTIFDYFWREEMMLSTATYLSDGVGFGFLTGIGSVLPSMFALQGIYLLNHYKKFPSLPYWCSAAILILFFCGYYIYVSASNIKHKFRINQFSPSLSNVQSIPTSKKKRIIVSGWWGIVRHPNYLGLLIMITAWTLPCGFSHFLPYGPLVLMALILIIRIFRIEAECQTKYGPAWKNYTERVRSRLIPYVF